MMASMSEMTRRDVLAGVAALALSGVEVKGQTAPATGPGTLGMTKVMRPELVSTGPGIERWDMTGGTLGTGETVGMHESRVQAGTPGSALHRIAHSEMLVVVEGTLEIQHDGGAETAPAGSVIYVAYGTTHAVRNVGTVAARYFVIQIGGDTKHG